MSKKKKNPGLHIVIASEQGLEAALNRYVEVSLKLIRRKAGQEKEIAALKADFTAANKEDEAEVLNLEAGVQLFCETHRKALLPDELEKKSRDFGNAVIGFRLNPTSVAKIVDKDTWDRIAERLDQLPWGERFVVTKLSVDKEEVLKCRADLTAEQLAEAGLCFAQGETFFIEPKSELLEAARKPVEGEAAA